MNEPAGKPKTPVRSELYPGFTLHHLSLHIQRLIAMDQALQRDEPLTPRVATDMLKAAAWLEGWPADLHVQYIDYTAPAPKIRVLRSPAGQTEDSPAPNGVSIMRNGEGALIPGPVYSSTDLLPRIPGSAPLDYVDALLTAVRWNNRGSFKTAVQALLQHNNVPTGQVRRVVDGNGRATGPHKDLLKKILLTIQDKGRLTRTIAEQHQELLLRQPSSAAMDTAATPLPSPRPDPEGSQGY